MSYQKLVELKIKLGEDKFTTLWLPTPPLLDGENKRIAYNPNTKEFVQLKRGKVKYTMLNRERGNDTFHGTLHQWERLKYRPSLWAFHTGENLAETKTKLIQAHQEWKEHTDLVNQLDEIFPNEKTETRNGVEIKIGYDDWSESPAECDNQVMLIVTGHRGFMGHANLTSEGYQEDRGEKLAKAHYKDKTGKAATMCTPIWLFQHGNQRLERSRSCQWDSGFLGFLVGHKGDWKGTSYDNGKRVDYGEVMDSFVHQWNIYLGGVSLHFSIDVENSEIEGDACGGFVGEWFGRNTGIFDVILESEELVKAFLDTEDVDFDWCLENLGKEWALGILTEGTKLAEKAITHFKLDEEVLAK